LDEEREEQEREPRGNVWDHREEIGFLPAFGRGAVEASIHPFSFFGEMNRGPEFGGALIFAMLVALIVGFVDFFWDVLGIGAGLMMSGMEEGYAEGAFWGLMTSPVSIVLRPIFVVIGVFIWGGILHLFLLMFGAARLGFENTLKVVCYATAPTLLSVVPVCGSQVGWIWGVVITVIGLQVAHGIGTAPALGAVLLPGVLCCGGMLLATFGLGVAVFGLGGG
jgi:hypothetical protein